jgi:hypothetical protein
MMNRLLKDQRGSVGINIIIIMLLVVFLGTIVLEFQRVMSVRDTLEYECQRAVNTALEYAMRDEYRQDGINILDSELAEEQFHTYFSGFMGLSGSEGDYTCYQDGKLAYTLTVDSLAITEGAISGAEPEVRASFTAVISNAFRGLLGADTTISINVSSRNDMAGGGT